MNRRPLDIARYATTPSADATRRVKARLRASLHERSDATRLLEALPEPSPEAEARVRRRVQASWLSRAGRAGARWGLPAAIAAVLAVGLFSWVRGPGEAGSLGRPIAQAPGPETPSRTETAPPERVAPSPTPPERRKAVVASRGTPSDRATAPDARAPAPRMPAAALAREPSGSGVVESLRTFGQAEPDSAERILTALRDELAECHARAGVDDAMEISLAIEIDGSPRAIAVDGEEPAATRFRDCAAPHLMGARFEVVDGVRAGAKEQITGGVIRFRFRGEP